MEVKLEDLKKGTRIRLLESEDPKFTGDRARDLGVGKSWFIGSKGTVNRVKEDETYSAIIKVDWDAGFSLPLLLDSDIFEIITEEEPTDLEYTYEEMDEEFRYIRLGLDEIRRLDRDVDHFEELEKHIVAAHKSLLICQAEYEEKKENARLKAIKIEDDTKDIHEFFRWFNKGYGTYCEIMAIEPSGEAYHIFVKTNEEWNNATLKLSQVIKINGEIPAKYYFAVPDDDGSYSTHKEGYFEYDVYGKPTEERKIKFSEAKLFLELTHALER